MMVSTERKLAGMVSLLPAVGCLATVAIFLQVGGTMAEILSTASKSAQIALLLLSGILSLLIAVVLLLPVEIGRKFIASALAISILIFAVAALQMSLTVGFVLVWPWSLYKLYRAEYK